MIGGGSKSSMVVLGNLGVVPLLTHCRGWVFLTSRGILEQSMPRDVS